jgi:DNA-binding NtrC family response regulator
LGSLNSNILKANYLAMLRCFTDAKVDTPGRLKWLKTALFFLDEIETSHLQSKLLQIIQTKMVTRLENQKQTLNVRIITATNLNLKQEVTDKNFREDLYYRINTMEIVLSIARAN